MFGIPDEYLIPLFMTVIGFLSAMFGGAGILWMIIRSMGGSIIKWTKSLDEHEAQRAEWRRTESALRHDMATTTESMIRLQAEVATERDRSRQRETNLQTQITKLSNEIAAANALLSAKDDQIAVLTAKLTEVENQNRVLLSVQGQYTTDRKNWETEKLKFDQQRAEWVAERRQLDTERQELIERISRLECTLEDVQKHGTGPLNPDVLAKAESSQQRDVEKSDQ